MLGTPVIQVKAGTIIRFEDREEVVTDEQGVVRNGTIFLTKKNFDALKVSSQLTTRDA